MENYEGKRLDGRYELNKLIGEGGMACVYKAYDRIDDRWVAVKILKEEFSDNSEFLRRFRNESKAISVLSHPNIVKVYDVSFGDRIQYIVMEYIEGITLKKYLERSHAIKWQDAIHFTSQILHAMQHAHSKGIIHRDIKPQNVMLLPDGNIKVMDFGIARFSDSQTHTMTDKAIGSVHYIAPEQARGDITDEKADIYSVGVMLYEMLTGQLPFEADNAVSVAIMQLQSQPQPPRDINPLIPDGLEEITLRAMQKQPGQRYQSAGEMLRDLDAFRMDPNIQFGYHYNTNTGTLETISNVDMVMQGTSAYADSYEYEEELPKSKKHSRGVMVFSGIGIGILIAAIVFLVMFVLNMFKDTEPPVSNEVVIPKFVGMHYEDDIKGNPLYEDFVLTVKDGYDEAQEPGVVLKQSLEAGLTVKTGKEITLIVNMPPDSVTLIDVTGQPQLDAFNAVQAQGMDPTIVFVADDQIASGYVVGTDPLAYTSVKKGSAVKIYVSTGPSDAEVKVPNVLGDSISTAKAKLEDAGLQIGSITYEDGSGAPVDTVLETDPLPGNKVGSGTVVNIVVSSGKMTTISISYHILLPNSINRDITVKIYRNGELSDKRVVNPSLNGICEFSMEGSEGVDKIVVTLDDQEYLHIDFNFDDGSATVTEQYEYTDTTSSEEVSSEETSSEESTSSETASSESSVSSEETTSSSEPVSSEETSSEAPASSVEAVG